MADTLRLPIPRNATHLRHAMSSPALHRLPLSTLPLLGIAMLLQACGGGGGSDAGTPATPATPTPAPTVSALSVDRLSYGQLSTFTVTGTTLATAASFSASGCTGLTLLAGGSDTQQRFSCTPDQALSVRVAASSGGTEFYNNTQAVPKPQVTLVTTVGSVVLELEPAVVKLTVDNFLAYVKAGFFNGTLFHRVIPGFMAQGGGFTAVVGNTLTVQSGLRSAIALESNKGLSNLRGTVAMARQNAPDTATSQFYVNLVDNTFLDYQSAASPGYAVFGHVTSGLAVVDAMAAAPTRSVGGFDDVPATNIVVQTASQTR